MTNQPSPPAETLLLPEEAYKFGVGPILMHSVEVVAEVSFDDELWLNVRAHVANGNWQHHGQFVSRDLYINANALKTHRQHSRRPPAQ